MDVDVGVDVDVVCDRSWAERQKSVIGFCEYCVWVCSVFTHDFRFTRKRESFYPHSNIVCMCVRAHEGKKRDVRKKKV